MRHVAPPPRARPLVVTNAPTWGRQGDVFSSGRSATAGHGGAAMVTVGGVLQQGSSAQARAGSPSAPPRASSATLLHSGAAVSAGLPGTPQQQQQRQQQQQQQVPQQLQQPQQQFGFQSVSVGPTRLEDRHDRQSQPGSYSSSCTSSFASNQPPRPLIDGEVTGIGRYQFVVGEVIGEGAYARVWVARLGTSDGEEIAIKEMRCGQGPGILPDATVQRAMFEIQAMQRLVLEDEGSTGDAPRVDICAPRVVDHQFWQLGPEMPRAYICRVAMTRRRGQPLVSWLETRAAKKTFQPPYSSEMDDVSLYCTSFMEAANAAFTMLAQLGPTFERLNSKIALHRDVNARNLLVYSPMDADPNEVTPGAAPSDASQLEFSVVDFGSSTDAKAWLGSGEGSWQQENPTGDARYWGPANWVRFLGGARALAQEPGLLRQYTRRLDLFAVAICALEVMAKLHTAECPSEAALRVIQRGNRSFELTLVQILQSIRMSWSAYWSYAIRSFDQLAEYSRLVCLGDQARAGQTWQDLTRAGIPEDLRARLHALCGDLSRLSEEITHLGPAAGAWSHVGDLASTLREMTHESSALEWPELNARLSQPLPSLIDGSQIMREAEAPAAPLDPIPVVPPFSATVAAVRAAAAAAAASGHAGSGLPTGQGLSANVAPANTATSFYGDPWPDSLAEVANGITTPAVPQMGGGASVSTYAGTSHLANDVQSAGDFSESTSHSNFQEMESTASSTQNCDPVAKAIANAMHPRSHLVDLPRETPSGYATGSSLQVEGGITAPQHEPAGRPSSVSRSPAPSVIVATLQSDAVQGSPCSRTASPPLSTAAMPPPLQSQQSPPHVPVNTPISVQAYTGPTRAAATSDAKMVQNYSSEGRTDAEREHEALRILRQVESEVRTLKRWYTEAIEAMRSPPFPTWNAQGSTPPLGGTGAGTSTSLRSVAASRS